MLITAAFDEDVGVGRILVNDASCPRRAGQQAPPRLGWPLRAPARPRSWSTSGPTDPRMS